MLQVLNTAAVSTDSHTRGRRHDGLCQTGATWRVVNTAATSAVACRSSPCRPAAAHSPTARMFSRTPENAPLRSCFRSSAGFTSVPPNKRSKFVSPSLIPCQ